MEYKQLPVGIDNFEKLIENGYYYVDKTLLIKKLLDMASEVILFTRPRRFGKSLNLSMLQYYFEKNDKNSATLFDGLKITSAGESYSNYVGKYPVIMLNFKVAKLNDFEACYKSLCRMISLEFARHQWIIESGIFSENEIEEYTSIQNREADYESMVNSIKFLTECLEKVYGEKAILLIDEYDVPLENAYFCGFYSEMIDFIRGVLSNALKTNNALFRAVLTGCLRISKESIFTGLNNLEIVSIDNEEYGEYFGFTEEEVKEMLAYYSRIQQMEQVKEWYNGYLFGKTRVYNPWSLINYMKKLVVNDKTMPQPYWSNTSSNSIVKELIERIDVEGKMELEILMTGGTIEKAIHEDITYEDIYTSMNNLWNFLYFTGYLKKVSERFENRTLYVTMKIPNEEVAYIYENHIKEWTRVQLIKNNGLPLYEATLQEDVQTMEREIKKVLMESISYHDTNNASGDLEAFYHGIMLGLYRGMEPYVGFSNRESGNGRPDLIVKCQDFDRKAFIFEFKIAEKPSEIEAVAEKALAQIEKQEYKEGLIAEGYTNITVYGVGFFKKNCKVRTNRYI